MDGIGALGGLEILDYFLRFIRSVSTVNYLLRESQVLKMLIFKYYVNKNSLETRSSSKILEYFTQRCLHFSFHLIRKKYSD